MREECCCCLGGENWINSLFHHFSKLKQHCAFTHKSQKLIGYKVCKLSIMFMWKLTDFILRMKQGRPYLESSLYLNLTLRHISPWDPWTLEPLDLGILGPFPSSNTFSYFPLHPLTSVSPPSFLADFIAILQW